MTFAHFGLGLGNGQAYFQLLGLGMGIKKLNYQLLGLGFKVKMLFTTSGHEKWYLISQRVENAIWNSEIPLPRLALCWACQRAQINF